MIPGQNGVADTLQVITGGKSIWSVQPVKGTWVRNVISILVHSGAVTRFSKTDLIHSFQYNFILEVGSPGGLWVSTGSAPLTKVYTGSLGGSGGTDWHIGARHRLPGLASRTFGADCL